MMRELAYLEAFRVGDLRDPALRPGVMAAVNGLVDLFVAADQPGKEQILEQIPRTSSAAFLAYAWDAAVEAVKFQRPEILQRGLLALAIENEAVDRRDTLRAVVMIHNSARKFPGINIDDMFAATAKSSCEPFASMVASFVHRPWELISLRAVGIRETKPPAPFGYEEIE